MTGKKTFQDLTISNAFMFSAVMADEEICRRVIEPELVKFLEYVRASAKESERDFQDSFVKCLQDKIRKIKDDRGMEERYMLLEEMMRDEREKGRSEGRKEGWEKGRKEGQRLAATANIITLLEMLGPPPEELRERIEAEQDNNRPSQWLRLAARAETLDEFTKVM